MKVNSLFLDKRQQEKSFPVDILGKFPFPVETDRNLGVWFDSDFSFLRHVQNICKSFFFAQGS